MAEFVSMLNKLTSLLKKLDQYRKLITGFLLIRMSGLFDKDWYLAKNPDVAQAGVNPWLHYVRYGGFEGRDPGPGFSSQWYLDTYVDVKKAGINPLVHYLGYGRKEGRTIQPQPIEFTNAPYKCSVCQKQVFEFLPLAQYYIENLRNHGFPYKPEEGETINFEQYLCPHCGASDRDRLYACYLKEKLPHDDLVLLLDIAPSLPLSNFINTYKNITRHTADMLVEGVDFAVDIMNMPEINSDTYDILICSHVLEHVKDDKKALSELYRVLKPGGWGIIMVPIILTLDQIDEDPQVTDESERWRRFGQFDHVRLHNKSGFVERVEAAGFTVKQLGIQHFGESVFKEYGFTKTSVLYIAEKIKVETFTDRILNLIRENSYYEFSEVEEFYEEPRWDRTAKIEHSWSKRRKIQDEAFEKLSRDYDLDGLQFTYDSLSDEYSREMFLKVIVARVLGPLKTRFPLYYSHIWKYFDKIDELKMNDTCLKVGVWDFYLYNLEEIGFDIKFYSNKIGVFIDFFLEQYKYQNKVYAKAGDYVIDGGACFGDTALYFASLVKDKGKVFSFEFIRGNLNVFNKNIKLNPDKQNIVELVERPLWGNSETELSAVESGTGSHLSNSKVDENAQLYKTISIDDFVAQKKIEKINFIKLDIEGAELETLKGAAGTIGKYKPQLAICVYHKNSDFWEIPRFLKELVPEYELYLDHFITSPLYETVLFARINV